MVRCWEVKLQLAQISRLTQVFEGTMSEIITLLGIFKHFKNDLNCIEKGELKYKPGFFDTSNRRS